MRRSMILTLGLSVGLAFPNANPSVSADQHPTGICSTLPATILASPEPSPVIVEEDRSLIDAMIAGHTAAIAVANVGLERATDPQVYRMALRVAESQAGELQLLRHWRSVWFPSEPAVAAGWSNATAATIAFLCSAEDNSFDRIFFEQLIDHHTAAIATATQVHDQAQHQELIDFAATVLTSRQTEISIMQSWLDAADATPSATG
ncbi:MAG: DUF305 domain-containing protein [Thermomicrobiales bacterium]|nr:DUF305 domain-containing protein [Thermomicrobiales bacterium]MCO5223172.1 DUF305 domain-containing protein [Thermomicrobiales bacterium]